MGTQNLACVSRNNLGDLAGDGVQGGIGLHAS